MSSSPGVCRRGWGSRSRIARSRNRDDRFDLVRALAPQRVEHVVLGPLSLAALNQVIESRVRLKLSRPLLVRLAEASEGNPFYALEIAGALARGPALPAPGDPLPVPRTLYDLLIDRVTRLSAPARMAASADGRALAPDRRDPRDWLRVGVRRGGRAARVGRGRPRDHGSRSAPILASAAGVNALWIPDRGSTSGTASPARGGRSATRRSRRATSRAPSAVPTKVRQRGSRRRRSWRHAAVRLRRRPSSTRRPVG